MSIDRRKFLKMAGLTALGLSGTGAYELLKPGALEASHGHDAHGSGHGSEAAEDKNRTRWAMLIDMTRCEAADVEKASHACHHAHNVPDMENPKHAIKWLWGETYEGTFPDSHNEYQAHELEHKTFPLMCNHCDKPPCVRVCPTQATFRRPDGIVAMDYHRCIGCRFCMAACPYGSRSFNFVDPRTALKFEDLNKKFPTRYPGAVEKCNFCVERLADGLQPACVEAVPHVFTFGNLADPDSNVRKILRERTSLRRKLELGTKPSVFYLV
jgi:molybdopterin-containing oxidoreductase family iron-sulfur binding subunit